MTGQEFKKLRERKGKRQIETADDLGVKNTAVWWTETRMKKIPEMYLDYAEKVLNKLPDALKPANRKFKTIREEAGLDQEQFSRILKCSQANVSGIEKGIHQPLMEHVIIVAKRFNKSIDEIISED